MDLYSLLPSIVRYKDRLGSGTGYSNQETIIQKVFYAIEQECDTTSNLIEGLKQLVDPETCPTSYLPLLQAFLGSKWPAFWSEEKRRQVIKALGKLYHHSGQRLSWVSVLNLFGLLGYFPWELWKGEIYEDVDYVLYGGGSYYGLFHAARVDIRKTDETLIELTELQKELIENFRPIHVLIRKDGEHALDEQDVSGKAVVEVRNFKCGFTEEEELSLLSDSFSLSFSCIASCEVAVTT